MFLAQDHDADELLARDPLALLIGMVLDQQIPMEKAFRSPHVLRERLGAELDAGLIAGQDPERLVEIFSTPPALHRFPGSMAKRVQQMCAVLVEEYGGRAAAVWEDASTGEELRGRLSRLPGFGEQKARIFLALLGKQYGVRPTGWREASAPYGKDGIAMSVADVTGAESLLAVRAAKAQAKAQAKAARAQT